MRRTRVSPVVVALFLVVAGFVLTGDRGGRAPEAQAAFAGQLLINEVLYDAIGPDEGGEFIELLLTGEEPLDLGRVSLERGNGARPGDWRESWRGDAGDTLNPGVHSVVGGALVAPLPRAVVELGLQNGPDACRALVDGVVVDVVGWGALEGREFFAGEPAADVAAGTSLGRVPDGRSTANNRADLVPLPVPSPGAPNRRPPPLKLRTPGHRSDASARPVLFAEWVLEEDEDLALGTPRPARVEVVAFPCSAPAMAAAATVSLEEGGEPWNGVLAVGPLDPGPLELCLTWNAVEPLAPAHDLTPDTLRVPAFAGLGPLRVSEFLYRPADGGPEWIELVNASPETLAADRFALADARLDRVGLAGAPVLAPGDLLVVAEEALGGRVVSFVLGSRWPALNDFGEPVADRIRILDEAGRTSDDVAYAGGWAPAGQSVERVAVAMPSADPAAWSTSPFGPTPGRPNGAAREFPPGHEFLRVEPSLLFARTKGPVLLWVAGPLRDGAIAVHAMDGRLVRRFTGGDLSGRRFIVWDGRDESGGPLAPGLYLLSLTGEPAAGAGASGTGAPHAVEARATLLVAP